MSLWVIDKESMDRFVASVMADYRVVGPVAKGNQFVFGEIEASSPDPDDFRAALAQCAALSDRA